MKTLLMVSILLGSLLPLLARPVSYTGGWTLMLKNNWERNRVHVHYSPTYRYSVGLAHDYVRDGERHSTNLQVNHLLKRWNQKHSQANLYLKTQLGLAYDDNHSGLNSEVEVAWDWETRRYFTMYALGGSYADGFDDGSFHQMGRVGIAPYVGDYGDIHTWLMLQAEHHPSKDGENELIVTPLVRVFKGDSLFEIGVSDNEQLLLNFRHLF